LLKYHVYHYVPAFNAKQDRTFPERIKERKKKRKERKQGRIVCLTAQAGYIV